MTFVNMTRNNNDTSNFYQHTASLQGVLHERELKQYSLLQELGGNKPLAGASNLIDRQSSLYQYWKKLLEDERKNNERNHSLLKKWDDLEHRITVMAVKTEKLKLLKEEYFSLLHRLYVQNINQRDGWSTVPSIPSSARSYPKIPSDLMKERQCVPDYAHNQRVLNRTQLYRSVDGSVSQTLLDSGLAQTRSSYSELNTPRTIQEPDVQTENPLSTTCHSCGQKIPGLLNFRNGKSQFYNSEIHSMNYGFQTPAVLPSGTNKSSVCVEQFGSNIPSHSSPFTPLDRPNKAEMMSLYNTPSREDYNLYQNAYQIERTESALERHPSSDASRQSLQIPKKHASTQYSPPREPGKKRLTTNEGSTPTLEKYLPDKSKMQFGTFSATLSNVSSISSQNEAVKAKEAEPKVDLTPGDTDVLTSSVPDAAVINEIKRYTGRQKKISLKEKCDYEFKKDKGDESVSRYMGGVVSDLNTVPQSTFVSPERNADLNVNKAASLDLMDNTRQKIPRAAIISSNSSLVGNIEQNKIQVTNSQSKVENDHHKGKKKDVQNISPSDAPPDKDDTKMNEPNSLKETGLHVQSVIKYKYNLDVDINDKREPVLSEHDSENSHSQPNQRLVKNMEVNVIHDKVLYQTKSVESEKSSSGSNFSANLNREEATKTPSVNNTSLESQHQITDHHPEISAPGGNHNLSNASGKNKGKISSSSSDTTDIDEKLNDSDDSFFDKEIPLTATAAYQRLLAGHLPLRSKKDEKDDNSDNDDVENELAAAVFSETTQRTKKDNEAVNIDGGTATSLGSPLKILSPVGSSSSKDSSIPERNKSISTSVFPRTTQILSKATRKALSLDLDSDSDDGITPAPAATSVAGKTGGEDSDEFDFYD